MKEASSVSSAFSSRPKHIQPDSPHKLFISIDMGNQNQIFRAKYFGTTFERAWCPSG